MIDLYGERIAQITMFVYLGRKLSSKKMIEWLLSITALVVAGAAYDANKAIEISQNLSCNLTHTKKNKIINK